MNRRLALALAVAAAGLLAVGVALAVALRGDETEPAPELRALEVEHCRDFADDDARSCYSRAFLAMVDGVEDPRPAVVRINDAARSEGGFLLENCHVVMHTVGRTYARDSGVTLATLMDHLPADNDPGCPAGFAHRLVTGVAPDIDASDPREAVVGLRRRRHALAALQLHARLRPRLHAPLRGPARAGAEAVHGARPGGRPDCAQGAYHDYWFAVAGADDAKLWDEAVTDPYRLCRAQPEAYVRPCWYRAFLETRPAGFRVAETSDIDDLCAGLEGLQREGCVTAASLIGPPDPARQLLICSRMRSASDAANCVRGTKVQNLQDAPTEAYVQLVGGCERFAPGARRACYRWLGEALAVLTDGEFEQAGCARLGAAARRRCEAGARTMEDALVTFS